MYILPDRMFILFISLAIAVSAAQAQKLLPFKLPDTQQSLSFTTTQGEDADYLINPLSFKDNGDGTITDNVTGLMWQKTDGGEMTIENSTTYCNNLTLAGYSDWRLPTGMELFSINHYNHLNPALDTVYFTKTLAEYWWTSEKRFDDQTKIWAVNAGGGIGAHPKSETLSAGGIKRFHVRAVRNLYSTTFTVSHFTDNGDGTISDNFTGLIWQKVLPTNAMNWEAALLYGNSLSLAGKADWRLPNIKELQSLNDANQINPSFSNSFFSNLAVGNYWSSTTLQNTNTKAWDINTMYGIVSYNDKTIQEHVILVRGGLDNLYLNINEVQIPGGEFVMGDHFGFVDPNHPSDEIPLHTVKVDSFIITNTETTNQQFLAFLNSALLSGSIHVQNNIVYNISDTNRICFTNQFAPYYSISYNGTSFTMADFRAHHPMVGVMWIGAAAYCNWLSQQNGLQECYNTVTWNCDFSKDGYRLPTEAEWEYSARGGHLNPYFNYPCGDSVILNQANLPASGDPYESGSSPNTTPVGFYDGTLKQKSDYNWPGSATNYQTSNGENSYGLFDVQGNVWEFVNDWYGQNYYSQSPYNNPQGPVSGFIMPDGKPYRGMRGGNWYNGYTINGVNDGHSRVSNRNPSYYRGPQDPNHPWYHVGFRIARNLVATTGIGDNTPENIQFIQNYPNPFTTGTTISFTLQKTENVKLTVFNILGKEVAQLVNEHLNSGKYNIQWRSIDFPGGIYTCKLQIDKQFSTIKMILVK